MVISLVLWSNESIAQKRTLGKQLQIDLREVTLDSALNYISYKTNVFFSYSSEIIDARQRFTIHYNEASLEQVLDQLLKGTLAEYTIVNGQVILFKNNEPTTSQFFFEKVTLRGNVRDITDNAPIPGINVYVAGTLKGSSTDINGNFEIENLTPGPYEIIFSHVVYKLAHAKITVEGDQQFIHIPVKLEPDVMQLKEVEIIANSDYQKNWQKGFKIFEREFLGDTQNSKKCTILNPEILDIDYNKKTGELKATATAPLLIRNDALGYKINYILELFEHDNRVTRLLGISNFEELTIENKSEYKKIIRNRQKSYNGSMAHFLRALTNDKLRKEGFVIDEIDALPNAINNSYYEMPAQLHADRDKFAFDNKLKFTRYLLVLYTKEYESTSYIMNQVNLSNQKNMSSVDDIIGNYNRNSGQISFIKLNLPVVTINTLGFFNEPLAVTTYGYWSWERIADAMPFDYVPK
jgi:hypothetical protein